MSVINFLPTATIPGRSILMKSASLGLSRSVLGGVGFANLSNSFETPTTTEFANPDGSGGFNSQLDSQQATNVEVGWRAGDNRQLLELAIFAIDLKDELVPFEVEAFPGRTFFANAGESERQGFELAYQKRVGNWQGSISYTFSDFDFDRFIDANGRDFSGRQLPGVPRHFGQLGLEYSTPSSWSFVLESFYSGGLFADNSNQVSVDEYWVSDFRLSRQLTYDRWQMNPFLGINNLANQRYNSNIRPNAFGGRFFEPAPDRSIYAGIQLRYR